MVEFYETENPTPILDLDIKNIVNIVKTLKELVGDDIEIYVFCEKIEIAADSTGGVHLGFAIDRDISKKTIDIKAPVGNKTKIFKFSKIISYNCDNNSIYDILDKSIPEISYSTFIKQTRTSITTKRARELGLLERFSMINIVYEK